MPEPRALAERLYAALSSGDAQALLDLLHPEFRGSMTAGMPLGVGGMVAGARAMLVDVWGVVGAAYDVTPHPDEFLEVGPDELIVFGRYLGRAKRTGHPVTAAFVHRWRVQDDRLASLWQLTDSQAWHLALEESPGK